MRGGHARQEDDFRQRPAEDLPCAWADFACGMLVNEPVHRVLMTADREKEILFELGVRQIGRAVGGSKIVKHGENAGKSCGEIDFHAILLENGCFFDIVSNNGRLLTVFNKNIDELLYHKEKRAIIIGLFLSYSNRTTEKKRKRRLKKDTPYIMEKDMKMKINVIRAGLLALVVIGAMHVANGQDMRSLVRDFAQLRADMRILQEDQKVLLDRITVMAQENVAKDAQIAELQKMLTMQENRIQGIEKDLSMRLEQLRKALESEKISRHKDLESAIGSMAAEISKLDKVASNASAVANAASAAAARRQAPPPPPAYVGSYKEIEVKRGDNLSLIAQAAGVPISTLRQINNLKNDTIFVGQKLKIPVVQK